ncbi:MAG: hypothetical protein ACOCPN_04640 [Desulfonatronovibrionaceae bacterium]
MISSADIFIQEVINHDQGQGFLKTKGLSRGSKVHDYQQILTQCQEKMARQYLESPSILNVPGVSTACKIDHFYYLILEPSFFISMSLWCGFSPELIRTTLTSTGNLIRLSGQKNNFLPLDVALKPDGAPVRVRAGFLLAEFIDKGLKIYARQDHPPGLSDLRIMPHERELLEECFQGKTHLNGLSFA